MCHERQFTRFPAPTGPPPNTRLHPGPERLHQPQPPERCAAGLARTASDRNGWSRLNPDTRTDASGWRWIQDERGTVFFCEHGDVPMVSSLEASLSMSVGAFRV